MQNFELRFGDESKIVGRLRERGPLRWLPRKARYCAAIFALIAWLPLLVLSAINGSALGGKVEIPLLLDLAMYARFFVALPIAIVAREYIGPRVDYAIGAFSRSRLVDGREIPRLEAAVSKAKALKDSVWAEIFLLFLVCVYVATGLPREHLAGISSWDVPGSLSHLWFLWISMPLLLFPWFLWIWRILAWGFLLFRISKLRLRVIATHPDGVGGLNFINTAHRRFSILVLAISSILCASIGEEILLRGAMLRSFESELAACFVACLVVALGPLMPFTRPLVLAKLRGWRLYGGLASRYVRGFDDKWILRKGWPTQDILGSPDLQSLADLKNSYDVISKMRTILPGRSTIGIFAFAYVVPVIPLLMTVIPLRQVFSEVYKLLVR